MTTQAAALPRIALEAVVVVPADSEHNCQGIGAGVALPCKPSADKKKQRANIEGDAYAVCNHITKFNKRHEKYKALVDKARDKNTAMMISGSGALFGRRRRMK